MKTVLVVDDREENRYLLRMVLEGNGYRVLDAANGEEALAIARADVPDIVVSDLLMPVVDGFTLLRHWKEHERLRQVPFVVYTATYTQKRDEQLALQLGADAFVVKPVEPARMVEILHDILGRATARAPVTADSPAPAEKSLKLYSEVLVNKLEQKCEELEQQAARLLISERQARSLSSLYSMLSETNRAIIKAADPDAVCQDVCRIAVERGGFAFAWIGMVDRATGNVDPVAMAGAAGDWLRDAGAFSTRGEPRAPVEFALRTQQAWFSNDLQADGRLAAMQPLFDAHGLRSAYARPLRIDGEVAGAMAIYAAEPERFGQMLLELLEEMTDDLSFALQKARDDALRREMEAQLRMREESCRLNSQAVASSPNGVMITVNTGSGNPLIYVNPAFERITGFTASEVLGRDPRFLLWNDREQMGIRDMTSALREQREARVLLRNYRKDGTLFWNELSLAPVREPDGSVSHYVGIINDLTERVRYEQQLERQFNEDALTGLASRNLLRDRAQQAIAFASHEGRSVALLFIDVDDIKRINDSLGHAVGDEVLRILGRRISGCLRDRDTPCRLGGDEFVILVADLAAPAELASIAESVREAIAAPMEVLGREIHVTASIGGSLYPQDGSDYESLLRNADAAMYVAKESGRNRFSYYASGMNESALRKLDLEGRLRHALQRDELVLFYQPLVDSASGTCDALEALLRWQPPGAPLVSPADFIPLAEETGLIVPIGEWVLREACRQCAAWRAEGLEVRIAVNLAARQFRDSCLVDIVRAALAESGLPPGLLKLEITEGTVMQDAEAAARILAELKALGVSVSVDDFGTGYSSLAYLRRFPIDQLKIDRSFVQDVDEHPDSAAIVEGIIRLAQSLRLQTVAEGVETGGQRDVLVAAGCDLLQGYLYSPPRDAGAIAGFLREHARQAGGRPES